jgi:hypothetical protein
MKVYCWRYHMGHDEGRSLGIELQRSVLVAMICIMERLAGGHLFSEGAEHRLYKPRAHACSTIGSVLKTLPSTLHDENLCSMCGSSSQHTGLHVPHPGRLFEMWT